MTYVSSSTVHVGAWAAVSAKSEITYRVYPAADTVEISLGGGHGLDLQMSEAALRHCVTTFTNALTAFDAANGRLPHSAG
ncbi:MAG: hypothetical protein ACRDRY_12575 [Pseudonocardiaceae bacterium]